MSCRPYELGLTYIGICNVLSLLLFEKYKNKPEIHMFNDIICTVIKKEWFTY